MSSERTPQLMKPSTAAQKLGVYLPATPESFQNSEVTRAQLDELNANPPEWLVALRADGPHPRSVVAGKLGVSNAGLARSGISDALTTVEIQELLKAPPQWLVQERATQAEVRDEKQRIKERDAWRRQLAAEAEARGEVPHGGPTHNRPSSGGRGR
jgi:hypothetical protein